MNLTMTSSSSLLLSLDRYWECSDRFYKHVCVDKYVSIPNEEHDELHDQLANQCFLISTDILDCFRLEWTNEDSKHGQWTHEVRGDLYDCFHQLRGTYNAMCGIRVLRDRRKGSESLYSRIRPIFLEEVVNTHDEILEALEKTRIEASKIATWKLKAPSGGTNEG